MNSVLITAPREAISLPVLSLSFVTSFFLIVLDEPFFCRNHGISGTLSENTSTGELGSKVGSDVVCTTDRAAVLVTFDHEGYVVCHWPLS